MREKVTAGRLKQRFSDQQTSESPGGLVQVQAGGPHTQSVWFLRSREEFENCTSKKFPDNGGRVAMAERNITLND